MEGMNFASQKFYSAISNGYEVRRFHVPLFTIRPEFVHNERVYCTPIDGTLKMQFNEGSGNVLRQTIPG